VISDRMAVVLALLSGDRERGTNLPQAVAAKAADALGVDGIYAGLGTGPSGLVLAWGQEAVSTELEDLQFTLGQGPGPDTATGTPVLIPDLLDAAGRWPAFVPAAAGLGVRAVFALPLRIGAIRVGVLLAHRAAPGPLVDGALGDAFALADAVTVLLVHQQSTGTDRAGPADDGPQPGWARPATYRAQVHQATGMISAQLGVSLAEALVRLRAHAYADGRLIAEVAADVVGRRLRFHDDHQ
jgi:GAF domain-containing protein